MTLRRQLYDTTPLTNVLFALASQKWTVQGATSELIDNSFGEMRGNAKHVWVTFDVNKRTLTVLDNGQGMDHIGALFQLGRTIGRGVKDIGKYGQGGTMAILWLPTAVSIWTMRDGKVMYDDLVWADYKNKTEFPKVSDTWERASLRNTPPELFELGHGTMIRMHLRPGHTMRADTVQRELAKVYAPGLRNDRQITWTTITGSRSYQQNLSAEQFPLPTDPTKIVRFNFVVLANDDDNKEVHLPVTGTVALIDDLPYSRSTVSLGYGPRTITETRDCYQSPDGKRQYSGNGVAGWLDLGEGWQDFLTTTKDGIKNDKVRIVLMNHVFKHIEPLLKQTEEDRMALVLEGLRLDLTDVFNGLNELDFVLEESETETTKGHEQVARYPSLHDNTKPFKPFTSDLKADDEMPKLVQGQKTKTTSVARLDFIKQKDAAMNGALCRLQILSDTENNLKIEINVDHPVMLELLYGTTPIQKLALNLLLTREIAASLADNEAVLRRFVVPRLMKKLDQLGNDNGNKERLLARLLMDSARRPRLAA